MKSFIMLIGLMSLSMSTFADGGLLHATKQKHKQKFEAKYPTKEFKDSKHGKYKKVKEEAVKEIYPDKVPNDLFINPIKKTVIYKKMKDKIKVKDEGKPASEKLKFYLKSDPKFMSQAEGELEETAVASISDAMPSVSSVVSTSEVVESSQVSEL